MQTVDQGDEVKTARRPPVLDVVERLRPHTAAVALIAFYVAHFAWLSVSSQEAFETGAFDVGIFDQGTWLLSRFE